MTVESPKGSTRRTRSEDKEGKDAEGGDKEAKRPRLDCPASSARKEPRERIRAMKLHEDVHIVRDVCVC